MTIMFDLINNGRLNKLHCVCFVAFNIQHDLDVAFGDLRSNQVKGYHLEVKALALIIIITLYFVHSALKYIFAYLHTF